MRKFPVLFALLLPCLVLLSSCDKDYMEKLPLACNVSLPCHNFGMNSNYLNTYHSAHYIASGYSVSNPSWTCLIFGDLAGPTLYKPLYFYYFLAGNLIMSTAVYVSSVFDYLKDYLKYSCVDSHPIDQLLAYEIKQESGSIFYYVPYVQFIENWGNVVYLKVAEDLNTLSRIPSDFKMIAY